MSRYQVAARNPRYDVWVGWDSPLQSYFLQVYDRQGKADEQPYIWLGASGEHLDFADLSRAIEPYAALPLDLVVALSGDRETDR